MRTTSALLATFAAAAALAGCAGGDSAEPAPSADPAPSTTPESLRLQIYERAVSECASSRLDLLAAQYKVKATEESVVEAVARSLVERFDAGRDALAEGRAGCKQGFKLDS